MLSYLSAACIYLVTIGLSNALFTPFSSQSFALNSFSTKDPLAIVAFLAFGSSVLASFPLIFFTMRNWFISQAEQYHWKGLDRISTMTMLLLGVIGTAGVFCKDIGKLGSVAGAIFGSSMMFIFPSWMYINVLQKEARGERFITIASEEKNRIHEKAVEDEGEEVSEMHKLPLLKLMWNYLLLVGGVGIGAMGTVNSIKALFR